MAKDAERKRKLEQDQAEQSATPKRLKQSKGDSAKKSGSNGDAGGSPMVVISRTESRDSSKQTPLLNETEKRPSTGGKRSDSKAGAKQDANTATPSKVKKETSAQDVDRLVNESGNPTSTPSSSKKSKKRKKRKSGQPGEVGLLEEEETATDTQAGADKRAQAEAKVSSGKQNIPNKKKSQQQAGALVKIEDGMKIEDAAQKSKGQRKAEKRARRSSQQMVDAGSTENMDLTAPNQHGWSLSVPGAGRYIDHDPIFVKDDVGNVFLIAATNREVQLLSLDSSLVVRAHVVPDGRSVACYALSSSDEACVDVAYDNGTKVKWNWITAELAKGTFPGQETTVAMTTAKMDDGRSELFYITRSQGDYTIVGERKALHTTERRLNSIQVLHNGWYIVCLSATALTLGARKDPGQCDYVWVDIPVEKLIRCADARLVSGKKKQNRRPDLAVAVGDTEGQVHLYTNVSSVFASPAQVKLPTPRHLHWHREPVSALKFSKDGNYLLSGGKETVLVLWQLETGRQQFLPHLTAEIEHIVVSADGTRYALQMGDNSIMVLSSSELKPVANFAGLQLPISNEKMEIEGLYLPEATAVLHPKDPCQLLLSVPATQPKRAMDVAARPFLQTFDVRNTRHISRQALDRNNVTDLSRGPEKTAIVPPDVNLLAVSADGKWLATVAEWHPPATDLEHVVGKTTGLDAQEVTELQDQQQHRREIHLRFWRWTEDLEMWTLSTRVDSPHARFLDADPGTGAGSVLKLVADPSSNTFATIGTDSNVKIWKPKVRTRYGVPLKEEDGTDAIDWVCKRTISLPTSADAIDRADSPMDGGEELARMVDITDAALVFSQDGSMLACGTGSTDEDALPLVYFVSPTTGAVIATKTGLVAAEQELLDFGFIDHFFVSLSTGAARVWNLIDDSHSYTIVLGGSGEDQEEAMLAINHFDETFAVISYVPKNHADKPTPKVEVYGPKQTDCLFEAELTTTPVKILAGNGVKGYTILFEDGTIRTLSSATPAARPQSGLLAAGPVKEEPSSELAVVKQQDGDVEMADSTIDSNAFGLPVGDYTSTTAMEDDRPVVRPEQLAEIFDTGNSLGLPPVRDMFQAVVGLFGRKPREFSGDAMEVEVV